VISHGVRAKGKVRRFARANRMDRLATLTYRHEPPNRKALCGDLRRFYERFQKRYGRRPILGVIERGEKNGRLHVHLALNFYVPKPILEALWGHGFVDIRGPAGRRSRWQQRALAQYLAKYVSKSVEADAQDDAKERAQGEHRYLVTQGFTPKTYRLRYATQAAGVERMLGLYGHPDVTVPWGDPENDPIYGVFFAFPDRYLHPPPQPA
jgi:hypothetical protein